ncbi:MAG: class E sortase [Acidobacteriota bacterium]|nr:class E sortase [Acidobacteriota bacterium]
MTVVDSADVQSGRVAEDSGPGPLGSSAPQVEVAAPARSDGARPAMLRAAALVLGLLSAWLLLFAALLSSLQAHGTQGRLYAMYRSELANETAPYEAPIPVGDPVALMSVARLGIDHLVIVEGTTSSQLRSGPGHEVDTPLPGQVGTSVLMGRSFSYGGPFSGISRLRKGDEIVLTTAQGTFHYQVVDMRHPGAALPRPVAGVTGWLTLITSSGGWLGPLTPGGPVYVDASLARSEAQPVPAALPLLTSAGHALRGDTSALVPLIFWIEGLLVAAAVVAVGWWRWGRWQTWLVGVPLLLAASWGVSDSLMQFLPNLL